MFLLPKQLHQTLTVECNQSFWVWPLSLLSLIWNVCVSVHKSASGNWFIPNLIQTPLENYVKKCELSRQNLQTWCVFSIQSSLTQVDHFSSIHISFDILLIPFCHILSWQISCNILLPLKINGDAKLEGS